MKQKTIYQKPAIQQVMALAAGGFAQSILGNPGMTGTSPAYTNQYTKSDGSWD